MTFVGEKLPILFPKKKTSNLRDSFRDNLAFTDSEGKVFKITDFKKGDRVILSNSKDQRVYVTI